jgi:hypothetical protein
MKSKAEQYIQQSMWHSGFCVLDPEIAVDLSGLWDSVDDARAEFHNTEDLIRRFRKQYHVFECGETRGEGIVWIPVITKSYTDIEQRIMVATGIHFPIGRRYGESEQAEEVNDEDLL